MADSLGFVRIELKHNICMTQEIETKSSPTVQASSIDALQQQFGAQPLGTARSAEPVHFGTTRGEFGAFTNFAQMPVEIDGRRWPSTEHYYQAQKVIKDDPAMADQISCQPTPKDAAHLGRSEGRKERLDWAEVKEDVMRVAVGSKILQYPEVGQVVISTGSREIIERSDKDKYWGDGPARDGKNRLGAIFMEIRAILVSQNGLVPENQGLSLTDYVAQARARY